MRLFSWLRVVASKRLPNIELKLLAISPMSTHGFGEHTFYCCFEVHRLRLVKNLTPLWVSPVRKRVWALENKCAMLQLLRRLVYGSRDLCLQFLFRHKNNKKFQHSRNAPELSPESLIGGMRQASSCLLPHMVLSTWHQICQYSRCRGLSKVPDC
jgi:hypothetical protein